MKKIAMRCREKTFLYFKITPKQWKKIFSTPKLLPIAKKNIVYSEMTPKTLWKALKLQKPFSERNWSDTKATVLHGFGYFFKVYLFTIQVLILTVVFKTYGYCAKTSIRA